MGLVAYDDDSDSGSPPPQSAPQPLPPTKTAKKRIFLDLPPPNSESEPPAKKTKPNAPTSTMPSKGKGGLSALLPAPKTNTAKSTLRAEPLKGGALARDLGVDVDDEGRVRGTGGFVKQAVSLGGGISKGSEAVETKKDNVAPTLKETKHVPQGDFFGLSTPAVPKSKASLPTTKISSAPPASSSLPSISSAPKPAPRPPSPTSIYAFASQPTASDPYPGFHQLSDGSWEPKNAAAWAEYCRLCGIDPASFHAEPEAPKDFNLPADEREIVNVSGHVPKEEKPEIKRPDREKMVVNMKTTAQEITRVAKTRHQLTSLLIDAQRNKDELEDRIAAAKLNRRAGARNYGF